MARDYQGRSERSFSESDPEEAFFSDDSAPRRGNTKRMVIAALGGTCLFACVIAVFHSGSNVANRGKVSARELLEGPSMVNVASKNTMTLSKNLKAEDESFVRSTIQTGLQNTISDMKAKRPAEFRALEEMKLNKGQQEHIMKVVSSMADPRVQEMGFEVAKAVAEGRAEGRAGVKRRLQEKFEPRMDELMALRKEIYQTMDEKVVVNLDHMDLVKAIPEQPTAERRLGTGSEITDTDMTAMGDKFEKGLGILAGLVEQCRVMLDQIDFVGDSFGVNMKIPYWAKSLVGGLDFVSELSDCVMRSNNNQVKLMMCPMKYASAFSDFMSSLDNVMGMANNKMSLMGSGSGSSGTSSGSSSGATGWGAAGSSWGASSSSTASPSTGSVSSQLAGSVSSSTTAPSAGGFNWNR